MLPRTRPERARDEEGVALIAALLAVMILLGLAALFVATAMTESTVTGVSRDFETAIHVAEAGADAVVARVNLDPPCGPTAADYAMNCPSAAYVTSAVGTTPDTYSVTTTEEEWAIAVAQSADPSALVRTNRGDAYGIRPRDSAGRPMNVVYGVGFVPSRAAPVRVRVMKLQFDRLAFQPTFAVLTKDDLEIGGAVTAEGDGAIESVRRRVVHTNNDLTVTGNTKIRTGVLSAHLTVTNCPRSPVVCYPNQPEEYIPDITAANAYGLNQRPLTQLGGTASPTLWYDLCPDGTMRSASGSPCTGAAVAGGPAKQGWTYNSGLKEWHTEGRKLAQGAYYIFRGNARVGSTIGSGAVPITLIAEADPGDGGLTGNIEIRGGNMIAAVPDLSLLADRDIVINGGPAIGGTKGGLLVAGEQFNAEGSMSGRGSILAQDKAKTVNSKVSTNKIKGSFVVQYTKLNVPVQSVVRVIAWNEL